MYRIRMRDLSRSRRAKSDRVAEIVSSVLASGTYLNGEATPAFEVALGAATGSTRAVALASGTSALELAIQAAQQRKPGVVITTPNCGAYASIAANRCNVEVRLCDIDPTTHLIGLESLNEQLDDNVSAVIATHLYGNVVDVPALQSLTEASGAVVIEDAAQAFGGDLGGVPVGSLGWAATHSFFPTKNLGGVGDGGAVTTDESSVADLIARLRTYGWASQYEIGVKGGANHRMDEVNAAVLLSELAFVRSDMERRRNIAARYEDAIRDSEIRLVSRLDAGNAVHLCVLALPSENQRSIAIRVLREMGIDTAVHYPIPDHEQPFGLNIQNRESRFPQAEVAARTVLSVPCYAELESEEVDLVVNALKRVATGQGLARP